MLKFFKSEDGSVSVEATISLSAFMFAIVTILTVINICTVQAKMQVAINTTAYEISQYSYLYGLTGFNQTQGELAGSAKITQDKIGNVITPVNDIFNEIQNLGETGENTNINDPMSIYNAFNTVAGSAESIENAGTALIGSIEELAKDPKQLLFGLASMAASDTMDLAKSRLIAAPISKMLVQKHLVDKKGGSVEAYLKHMGVVPDAHGSYIGGLDFNQSHLFVRGSNEIRITVSYKVKIIPLLPIKTEFTFTQSAVTHGWLCGEVTFKSGTSYEENDTLWTQATVQERSEYIRSRELTTLKGNDYMQTAGLTDVQAYNPALNEFAMISSMNPLYSPSGEAPKTLDDLSKEAIIKSIEQLCGKMVSTTNGLTTVTTKEKNTTDGSTTKTEHNCTGATNKIILVIPEDEGLKAAIEGYIKEANTRGVVIEVTSGYGNGANSTAVPKGGE